MFLLCNTKTSYRIYQYMAALTANLCVICSEFHYGWPSPSIPILISGNHTFQITSAEGSWLTVTPLLGAPVGMLVVLALVDIVGRRPLILLSTIPYIIGGLLISFAKSSIIMFVGRFLAGCSDGMVITVIPMYLGEIAEPKIRGLLASMYPVCIALGILLINILGSYLDIDVVAFIATSVAVLILITFSWMPESPYFLLMRDNTEKARQSLQSFRGDRDISEELSRITTAIEQQSEIKYMSLDLFKCKSNRKSVAVALGLRSLQQLTGVGAITFYCKSIFERESTSLPPEVVTILYFLVQFICSIVASFIVDHSGRKPLLLLSTAGTTLSLLAGGIYLYLRNYTDIIVENLDVFSLVSLLCYNVSINIGLQTIPLLMLSEIFPTNIKALAVCLVNFHSTFVVFITSKFFYWTTEAFGMHIPFFTFSICCILGLVFIILYVPETKGKTLEDIQREFEE